MDIIENKIIKREIEKEKIIFVEGRDEENFFGALIKHMGLIDIFQVIPFDGKASMKSYISVVSKGREFEEKVTSVSIVRDCDSNYQSTDDEIKHALKEIFNIRDISEGNIVNQDGVNYGYLILPGNKRKGELEDLVIDSINGGRIHVEIMNYLKSIETITKPRKQSKAVLQIYFSSMKESDVRMGISAQRNYIDFNHISFNGIKQFISSL